MESFLNKNKNICIIFTIKTGIAKLQYQVILIMKSNTVYTEDLVHNMSLIIIFFYDLQILLVDNFIIF